MPAIDVDRDTYDKISFTASLLEISPSDVVARLVAKSMATAGSESLDQAQPVPRTPHQIAPAGSAWVGVHKTFKQHTIRGSFNPATSEVKVASPPWNGQIFASPTAAAQAVVMHYSGDRATPNTNGRMFWKLDASGRDLRSMVGTRF